MSGRTILFYWIVLLGVSPLNSIQSQKQDTVLVTKNFKFKDGIYLTFEDFKKNQPIVWEKLKADLYSNPQTCMAQLNALEMKENHSAINPHSLWGICLGGVPFIRLDSNEIHKSTPTFSCLNVRGKICQFSFSTIKETDVFMPVYNPATGRIMKGTYVKRDKETEHSRLLHFQTGEIVPFNVTNFKKWIQDDTGLLASLNDLTSNEAREKLFKCLLIYVDRHPVYTMPK